MHRDKTDSSDALTFGWRRNFSPEFLPLRSPLDDAHELDLLADKLLPGNKVLDCGSGSGFLTTAMCLLVLPNGFVSSIDRSPSLVDITLKRMATVLSNKGVPLKQVIMMPLDGTMKDALPRAPFDAIRVGFKLPNVDSFEAVNLCKQLRPGGRMIAHVDGSASLNVFDKSYEDLSVRVTVSTRNTLDIPNMFVKKVEIEGESEEEVAKLKITIENIENEKRLILQQLEIWKKEFELSNGRRPNRVDMANDSFAAQLFAKFSKLNK